MNHLYLGDCLNVLRDNIKDESVDLVYIDPPFNSKRDYNIFFDDKEIQTQRLAFEDTWTLKNIQDSLSELHTLENDNLWALLVVYQKVAPHAFPYLVMMSLRILELRRVLKTTGSFYLHCDPTMSHYLRTVCDIIFGANNFRNEISWKRSQPKSHTTVNFAKCRDIIIRYSKSEKVIFNKVHGEYDEKYVNKFYKYVDQDGRRYRLGDLTNPNKNRPNLTYEFLGVTRVWRWTKDRMLKAYNDGLIVQSKAGGVPAYKRYFDEMPGQPVTDDWSDIEHLHGGNEEMLGYPTQKPKELLDRIIKASSNEGDTILDGFCGCGTTVDAAESLHRKWIGIDISPIAISLIKRRLKNTYGKHLNNFEVRGIPADEKSAIELWKQNPNAFQDWWLTEFEVFSTTFGSKGADKGVDGIGQYLIDPNGNETIKAAFQVKGGTHIQSKDIDALRGAMEKHKCQLGVFLTIENPTKPMMETVASSGFVEVPGYKYPRLQILTLKDYFANKALKLPKVNITFKSAARKGKKLHQEKLDL